MGRVAGLAVVGCCLLAACGSPGHKIAPSTRTPPGYLAVRAPAWPDGGSLTAPVACSATNPGRSPAVSWRPGPPGTQSYAVTVTDPDAHDFLHWAVLGLPASTRSLPAGASPGGALPGGAHELRNGFGAVGYGGPCPPPGSRHRYVLTVWAVKGEPGSVDDLRREAPYTVSLTATYGR